MMSHYVIGAKSVIMYKVVEHFQWVLQVFVFPSLALIDQFHHDYLGNIHNVSILRISSDLESTTNNDTNHIAQTPEKRLERDRQSLS